MFGAPHCGGKGLRLLRPRRDSRLRKSNESAAQLGLNLPDVRRLLRSAAFPDDPTGAFYVRWSDDLDLPEGVEKERFLVFLFLRHTVRADPLTGWSKVGSSISSFIAGQGGDPRLVTAEDRRKLLDGLMASTARVKAPPFAPATTIAGEFAHPRIPICTSSCAETSPARLPKLILYHHSRLQRPNLRQVGPRNLRRRRRTTCES